MPREVCRYGKACYRKNPIHFEEFSHPWLDEVDTPDDGDKSFDNPANDQKDDELANHSKLTSDGKINDTLDHPKDSEEKIKDSRVSLSQNKAITQNESETETERKMVAADVESKDRYQSVINGEAKSENIPMSSPRKNPVVTSQDIILEIVHDSEISDNVETQTNKRKRSNSSSSTHSSSKSPKSTKIPINPLNVYLTKVKGMDKSVNNFCSISIIEILSSKWGQLQASAQFNYMFEVEWLLEQYPPCFRHLPILLVHQDKRETTAQLEAETAPHGNIDLAKARLNDAFGTHHTKMMLLRYESHLRVVIHTANLIEQDWREKTQGVWLSPLFPLFQDGEEPKDKSPTKFQTDLIIYLRSYKSKAVDAWCDILKKYDMSEANVFIIGSTPGRHTGPDLHKYGHMKLRKVLSSNEAMCDEVQPNWPVIGQFSSIGSLGSKAEAWLQGEFLQSLGTTPKRFPAFTKPSLKLVFPCVEDVRNSLEGYRAGGSLPYSDATHQKQLYLTKFLHRWKSDDKGRTRASPHIKSYFRVSPDMKKIHYAVLTSANLSKAAWGGLEKQSSQLCIRSYELGVLFLPKIFGSHEVFAVSEGLVVDGDGKKDCISFPVPFDLPLTRYGEKDQPWRWDIPYKSQPDSHGDVWIPS